MSSQSSKVVLLNFALPVISLSPLLLLIELHPGTPSPVGLWSVWSSPGMTLFVSVQSGPMTPGPWVPPGLSTVELLWSRFLRPPSGLTPIIPSSRVILRMSSPMRLPSRRPLWVSRARAIRVPHRFPWIPQFLSKVIIPPALFILGGLCHSAQ